MENLPLFLISLALLLLLCNVNVKSQTSKDTDNLYEYLLNTTRYNKRVRPITNQSHAMQLKVTFALLTIMEFNIVQQYIKIVGYHSLTWTNQFQTWTPPSFGGITTIALDKGDIWLPSFHLSYPADDQQSFGKTSAALILSSEGSILWVARGTYGSTCAVDITWFPADTQVCKITWTLLKYPTDAVDLHVLPSNDTFRNYEENSEWEVKGKNEYIEIRADSSISVSTYVFEITIKRRPTFFVLHLMIPVCFLSLLNAFVFVLPAESGERVGFSITVFLALAVFITVMSVELPRNSVNISAYSVYLIIYTFCSTFFVLVTIVSLKLYHMEDPYPVPELFQNIVRLTMCASCRLGRKSSNNVSDISNKKDQNKLFDTALQVQEVKTKKREEVCEDDAEADEQNISWIDVSKALDKIFLVLFVILLVIISTITSLIIFSR